MSFLSVALLTALAQKSGHMGTLMLGKNLLHGQGDVLQHETRYILASAVFCLSFLHPQCLAFHLCQTESLLGWTFGAHRICSLLPMGRCLTAIPHTGSASAWLSKGWPLECLEMDGVGAWVFRTDRETQAWWVRLGKRVRIEP